jgi:hypothetical protein
MSKSKTLSPAEIAQLLKTAHQTGTISSATFGKFDIVDVGSQIQSGLGVSVDDVHASDVVLLTMMPDDSSSIASAGNTDAVLLGHNQVIDTITASKQAGEVLAHTRYLNGEVLFPYTTISNAIQMNRSNYDPRHGTPLYDQTAILLGTVIAKTAELASLSPMAMTADRSAIKLPISNAWYPRCWPRSATPLPPWASTTAAPIFARSSKAWAFQTAGS